MAATLENVPSVVPSTTPGNLKNTEGAQDPENEGFRAEFKTSDAAGVSKDEHISPVCRPNSDDRDLDPLHWSSRKKNLILFIISLISFLPDYGSATGAVMLEIQGEQWGISADEVNHSQAGNVFMLGAAGIFIVIFSIYIGRLPVVLWFIVTSTATAAWCAGAKTFHSFMAARILNGFFSTVTQAGGLMFIQDMFSFSDRARKINIWAAFYLASPYLGPLLASFMLTTQLWPVPFVVYTAMTASCLALVVLFLEETYYDRNIPTTDQPPLGSRLSRLIGLKQWRSRHLRNSFPRVVSGVLGVIFRPIVLLSCLYYILTFAWAIGINTTLSVFIVPLYGFSPEQVGYFYFTPIVAVILGEITGHWLHDVLAKQYMRCHNGCFEPEVRLRAIVISFPFMVIGTILVGQSLQNAWHFMAASIAWGLYVYGIMITTVAISSYCLDSCPEVPGEVSAWLNFSRTTGGFIISYFQVTWATNQGASLSFAIQAGIEAGAFLIIIVLILWGKRLRAWHNVSKSGRGTI